jgi:hypothetical protein
VASTSNLGANPSDCSPFSDERLDQFTLERVEELIARMP